MSNPQGGGSLSIQPPLVPIRDHDDPHLRLLEERLDTSPFFVYWRCFVDPHPPVAFQRPGWRGWVRYDRRPDPPDVWAHLHRRVWAGGRGRQYLAFAVLDVDAPPGGFDSALRRIEQCLGLREGENCLAFTSPSWDRDRSFHLFVPVLYGRRCPTLGLVRRILDPAARALRRMGLSVEVFPQEKRVCRYPCGLRQHPIRAGIPRTEVGWREALAWLFELEPVELRGNRYFSESRPLYPDELAPPDDQTPELTAKGWYMLERVREIIAFGVPEGMTRNEAQFWIFAYHYRKNVPVEGSIDFVKAWVRLRHNGRSRSVLEAIRTGDWRAVDRHIERQGRYVYAHYWRKVLEARRARHYPDDVQWLEGWVSREDMAFIAQVFRGDIVNQRRLFEVISYMRPRMELGHEWIYVPYWRWEEFAPGDDHRAYLAFRRDLEGRGILEAAHEYRHAAGRPGRSYPKRFRLPGLARRAVPISEDGRPVQDFVQAAVRTFGGKREAAEALGLPERTAYAVFDLGYDADRICPGCGTVVENARENRKWCSDACRKRYERKQGL